MSTLQVATTVQQPFESLRRWLIPGLAAGAAFLAIELAAGAGSTSLWRFPEAIAEMIGIPASMALPAGLAIHFAFSIGLGVLFIAVADRLHLRGAKLLLAGALYMQAESAISIWVVLHTLFPDTLPILFSAVPFWASFVGRVTFGLVLAYVYGRQTQNRAR